MKNGFCIILSRDRIYHGVVLYKSLVNYIDKSRVFILCIDNETFNILGRLGMSKATLIHKSQIESEYPQIMEIKRNINEYCWTLKPVFLEYIFNKYLDLQRVIYLDADLMFFDNPNIIFNNSPNSSILLSRHEFDKNSAEIERSVGRYNSGFICFKRCEAAIVCIKWWKERCLEWCYDRVENGRFGDQKYLESFKVLSSGIDEINTPGVNIAPWNHSKYHIKKYGGKVYVDGHRLIFYHYCGFRILSKNEFGLVLGDKMYIPKIHDPYIIVLHQTFRDIEKTSPEYRGYYVEKRFETDIQRYSYHINI